MSDPVIKRALVSVTDKTGVVEFCRALAERVRRRDRLDRRHRQGARRRRRARAPDRRPHRLSRDDGRPRQDAASQGARWSARAPRRRPSTWPQADEHGIGMIDMVVVNLYAFEATVAREGVT